MDPMRRELEEQARRIVMEWGLGYALSELALMPDVSLRAIVDQYPLGRGTSAVDDGDGALAAPSGEEPDPFDLVDDPAVLEEDGVWVSEDWGD